MTASAKNRIKKVDVGGVSVAVDMSVLEDWEIVEAIAETSDESLPDPARLAASVRIIRMVLGADYARVKGEIREKNGGRLTAEDMEQFLSDVLKAVGAKN